METKFKQQKETRDGSEAVKSQFEQMNARKNKDQYLHFSDEKVFLSGTVIFH